MKFSLRIVLLTIAGLSIIGCAGGQLPSNWTNCPIIVDGQPTDWEQLPRLYNENLNVSYSFANDSTSFYLLLKTNNQQIKRMLGSMGVTVWISEEGKRDKDFGIRYRDPNYSNREPIGGQLNMQKQNRQESRLPEHLRNESLLLVDGVHHRMFPIEKGRNGDICADHQEDFGTVTMEIAIPFNHLSLPIELEDFVLGESITIGIDIPKPREKMLGGRGGGGGGMRGGGGPGGGGGRGGGGAPGGGKGMGALSPDKMIETIWIEVQLSDNQ